MAELMTVGELADYLRVTKKTIYRLLEQGKIPATKVGNQWRFEKSSIDAWLQRNSVGAKASILVIDDEQVVCDLLQEELSERGYLCTTTLSGKDALAKLATENFDVVLLDIRLPGMSGMEVLREIWLDHGNTATIMITAVNDVATAVEAMKLGASDYIVKPFDLDRVVTSIRTALETKLIASKVSKEIDAIARGVEAKLDPFAAFSGVVTERTVKIARQLGLPKKEIQRWAAEKAKFVSKKNRIRKASLDKPE